MQQHFSEEKISSKTIFEGRVISLTVDEARLADGSVHTREVVHHGGGAGVLAIDEKGRVAMVRQFRYAAGREMLEIPAGKIEPGEAPAQTALRELGEETGLSATHMVPFGSILPTCAYCTEVIWVFLATGLSAVEQKPDADEFLALQWLPLQEAVEMVLDGRIDDAKTAFALLKADALIQRGKITF